MTIEKRIFGKTGHMSSAVIFGGAALWNESQSTANKILDLLLEYDVNHIDVAAGYGDAELRIGHWMKRYRKNFFLATKTMDRDYKGVKESIMRSLDRLRTDHIDLMQMHSLSNPIEWDQAMGEEGALEALKEAKSEGLIKYIGVTGHGWTAAAMHQKSIKYFPFDSILLPWSWFISSYRNYPRDFNNTLKLCSEKNIAVQTIKAIARGPYAAGMKKSHTTWYQPMEDIESIKRSVAWVLSYKNIFLNSVGDVNILPQVLKAANKLEEKPSEEEMNQISKKIGLASIFGV
tara:strand:- start:50 stop:916 length:867 start_codon:yes stop_codon:yes gene_type:complete